MYASDRSLRRDCDEGIMSGNSRSIFSKLARISRALNNSTTHLADVATLSRAVWSASLMACALPPSRAAMLDGVSPRGSATANRPLEKRKLLTWQ